jgi:hypothetical protein
MTLLEILNVISCGADAVLGTGSRGCKAALERVSSIWLLPTGTVLDGAQELDFDYVQQLQAEGKLIVLKGVQSWTDNTPDDVTEDLEGGTKLFVRGAKYEFEASFINGMFFQSALNSLNSQGNYDAIFVDVSGNILGTKAQNGSLKGFTLGMVRAKKLTWGSDTAAQREGLMMQLLERIEVDTNWYFIQAEQLNFIPTSVDGVNEVEVDLSVPSAGTTITAKLTSKVGGKPFTGVPFASFLSTLNGVTSNPTAGDDSAVPGTYVLTVPTIATNDVVTLRLYDNANNRSAVDLDNSLWKSNVDSETVI